MSRARVALAWARQKLRRFASRAELERYQEYSARALLAYVNERSPFYRARLGSPSLTALRKMAPIDKHLMMANFDRLNTVGVRAEDAMAVALRAEEQRDFRPTLQGVTVGLSSGTSGSRGLFLVSDAERYAWAGNILARLLPGSLLSTRQDRVAFFLRANSNLYESLGSRRVRFSYFDLLEPLEGQLAALQQLAPTVLVGPPSLLVRLADCQRRGLLSIKPERVVSVAEVLDPLDEQQIASAFERVVQQVYQATEGLLGTSCALGTVHLAEDLVIVERDYLDAQRRRFSPIVTDLFRRTQPILRYRLDDILVEREQPCACGSVLTALERIEGRADDIFLVQAHDTGTLRPLYPDFVRRAVITSGEYIRAYHVHQTAPCALELYLEVDGDRAAARERAAAALGALFERFGGRAPAISFVDERVIVPGAKLRRVHRSFLAKG